MRTTDEPTLPSWRPGPARDAIMSFLEQAPSVPTASRVACLDNDGTLWCERPTYVQYDFFLDALTTAVRRDPDLAYDPAPSALARHDTAAVRELGLPHRCGADGTPGPRT